MPICVGGGIRKVDVCCIYLFKEIFYKNRIFVQYSMNHCTDDIAVVVACSGKDVVFGLFIDVAVIHSLDL